MEDATVKNDVTMQDDTPEKDTNTKGENDDNSVSVEELMSELAQLKAEKQKLQNKYNQASSEAAKTKQALRAKQTAEEREAEELAEQKRLADEEKENLRKELNHIKAVAAFKEIPESDTVELLIEAVAEKDYSAIAAIFKNEKERAVKEAVNTEKAKWLKENPPANIGNGDQPTITPEQFAKMSYSKRVEIKANNPQLYEKLNGR